jgi:hypothetical protein
MEFKGQAATCSVYFFAEISSLERLEVMYLSDNSNRLTDSMELIPSWEDAIHSATQEFLNILWSLKVHECVPTIPLLVPVLSQMTPVHATSSYFSDPF